MQVLGRSSPLRCRFSTVGLIIVVLHLTVCFVCMVTAASGQSPGDTSPNTIEIKIGESANITCRIFDGGNSSSIWFTEENTKKRIVQPNSEILILDAQTAVLNIRNASEHKGFYQCMSGSNAIGMTRVYVGTPPTDVKDFLCKGYDYDYMTCSFTKPENMIYTIYELNYKTDSDNQNYSYNCELQPKEFTYCNITYLSRPVYLPSRQIYYFNLTATNSLGSNSQVFAVNNYKSVVPAKLNIELRNITPDSITMVWKISKFSHYKEQGLEYKIRLKPEGFDWYNATDYEQCNNSNCSATITHLKYAFREYSVEVRVKVKTAKNEESMWSAPFIGIFKTQPRRPDSPPITAVGSFYINPTDTHVRLYWQQLPEFEENGPAFYYAVNETDMEGNLIKSKFTNETATTFVWNRADKYNFHIRSCNSLGQSERSSQIHVYPKRSDDFSPQSIATVYHNRTYTLSWKQPKNQNLLINYTVFWCLSKMESSNQCRGTIHFKYLDKHATNFTTDPQDHTLNLAVSANYANYITGMHWAICSADVSSDLMKLEPEYTAVTSSTIKLQWSSERVCTSILKGYNLTYCQVAKNDSSAELSTNCVTPQKTIVLLRGQRGYKEYTLARLQPYSRYRIEIFMYSDTKVGPTSDALFVNTKEAAPSAPRDLKVNQSSISSKSAIISWLPPTKTNGQLKFYTIWKNKTFSKEHNDNQKVYIDETNATGETNTPIVYKLESLNSYSNYTVYVTAHTVEESETSNPIHIATQIGIPTIPREVSITEDGNYGVLQWQYPEMPSGRVEFYVVAMIMKHRNKATSEDDVIEKISYVSGNSCKFRFPECVDSSYSYYLKIRAVNVAATHEIDHETFYNSKSNRRRRHTNPEISATVGGSLQSIESESENLNTSDKIFERHHNRYDSKLTGQLPGQETNNIRKKDAMVKSDFQCLDAFPVNEKYGAYTDVVGGGNDDNKFFSSSWVISPNIYKCIDFPFDRIVTIAVSLILVFAALAFMSFWLRKKYNKMKNINAVLPEELVDNMPNYQLGFNNVEKQPSDVSRSTDYLVSHKEKTHLLNSICNGSITGVNSLTQKIIHKVDEAQRQEHTPSNVEIDEKMSQSTDSVEMNDISTSSNCSPAKIQNKATTCCLPSQDDTPLRENNTAVATGYIKSASVMFNTDLPADIVVSVNNAHLSTGSGYVQPHAAMVMPTQPPAYNGYTTLDAMGKPVYPTGSIPSTQPVTSTSKISREPSNNRVEITSKNPDPENLPNESPPHGSNNNNNNLICGYVTQRQLAEFGQLLH